MAQPDRVPESTAQVVCDVLADEHSAAPAQGSRAMFEAGASFNGAQVEGSADFSEASFPNQEGTGRFRHSYHRQDLDMRWGQIQGPSKLRVPEV
jgi:hypothetical protein